MPRVVHFEICADDPETMLAFYEQVFGWKVHRWDGPQNYWLIETGSPDEPGIGGGLMRSNDVLPRIVNTIGVDDVDAFVAKVVEQGGEIVMEKHAVPGIGWHAYCRDPEGNVFGIHTADPAAK